MRVCDDTVIYITCPAFAATGGPEALHQLSHKLLAVGYDARMVYMRGCTNEVHPKGGKHPLYAEYDSRTETTIEDAVENIVVVPEIHTSVLDCLLRARTATWWLASPGGPVAKSDIYLAQSRKALAACEKHGMTPVFMLSDWINNAYRDKDHVTKRRKVAMSTKGTAFNRKISTLLPKDIEVVSISGMSRGEVKRHLRESMVYLDMGHHPGKDRTPREAVLSRCCVVTSLTGTATNATDVPIPSFAKFGRGEPPSIIAKSITQMVNNHVSYFEDHYRDYLKCVENEEAVFGDEIRNIFERCISC